MKMPEMGKLPVSGIFMPEYAEIFCEKGRSAVLSVFFRFVLRIRKGKEMDSFECMR